MGLWSKETSCGIPGTWAVCLSSFSLLPSLHMDFWQGVSLAEVMAPLRKLVHLINGEYLLAHCQVLPLIKLPHLELSLEEGYEGIELETTLE